MKPTINVSEDSTLVILQNIPADISFVAEVFAKIAEMDVDVDMISLSPAQSAQTSLSFTISDEDLSKLLNYTKKLNDGSIKVIVSSGNCKISIDDKGMENCPGVAANVFALAAKAKTDIRLITTSEAQISLLVTQSDLDAALAAFQNELA